jgi:GNAT superfamily N-acetyltransferase
VVEPTAADVRVRRIDPDGGLILRDLRLRSLADAPNAFGQPLEEARGRPGSEWHRSARQSSRGDNRTWLIAETDDGSIGLVQGRKRRPSTLLLFSMWVDPSVRRLGVGRALIEALEGWGRGWDATETILWVYSGNAAAIRFYRDLGFEVIQGGQDAESGARFGALAMRRDIRSPA